MRLTAWPEHSGKTGRTDYHRHAESLPEKLDRLIACGRASQRSRQQPRLTERFFVAPKRALILSAPVDEIEHQARQASPRELAHCVDAVRSTLEQPARHRAETSNWERS
jgi:hypothetical protein